MVIIYCLHFQRRPYTEASFIHSTPSHERIVDWFIKKDLYCDFKNGQYLQSIILPANKKVTTFSWRSPLSSTVLTSVFSCGRGI